MRLLPIALAALALASSPVAASWWSKDNPGTSLFQHAFQHFTSLNAVCLDYTNWDTKQLKAWLGEHNIDSPKGYSQQELQDLVKENWYTASTWTQDQYSYAQQVFADGRDKSIESWKDSELRDALVSMGVVNPPTARESLVRAVNHAYSTYSASASSLASGASAAASTAVYGDKQYQASKSVSSLYSSASDSFTSVAAQSSESLARQLDNTKDYVYSTWDDNHLRSYLEGKGVIKTKQQATRDQLLAYMRDTYTSTVDNVWEAWSDSYMVRSFSYACSPPLTVFLARLAHCSRHCQIKLRKEARRSGESDAVLLLHSATARLGFLE